MRWRYKRGAHHEAVLKGAGSVTSHRRRRVRTIARENSEARAEDAMDSSPRSRCAFRSRDSTMPASRFRMLHNDKEMQTRFGACTHGTRSHWP